MTTPEKGDVEEIDTTLPASGAGSSSTMSDHIMVCSGDSNLDSGEFDALMAEQLRFCALSHA